jgi:hypothetical protein
MEDDEFRTKLLIKTVLISLKHSDYEFNICPPGNIELLSTKSLIYFYSEFIDKMIERNDVGHLKITILCIYIMLKGKVDIYREVGAVMNELYTPENMLTDMINTIPLNEEIIEMCNSNIISLNERLRFIVNKIL